ncbi:MAG TPA: SAM-dependent methyltransferase, partial [Rikenellaceae bacterium]|nr:SAM-dependent methyltransferase [Rikenellaceae bacterium]
EELRKKIIENNCIQSLLHLSRGVFGADFGASSAVIKNSKGEKTGTYFRLVERTFQEFDQKHLRTLFEKTLANRDFKYKFSDYTKEALDITYSEDGNRIYYPHVLQSNFTKIPGSPIGYWVSEKIQETFTGNRPLSAVANPCVGLQT